MPYDVSSRGYLLRAQDQLRRNSEESLHYAAFELRCGIEARLQQYAEAWDSIPVSTKRKWKPSHLYRDIEKAFKLGQKYARLAITEVPTDRLLRVFYYTPVTEILKKDAEKLGAYTHAIEFKAEADAYWSDTRRYLEEVVGRLEIANLGTLLGPPMMKGTHKTVMTNLEFPNGDLEDHRELLRKGQNFKLEVTYPDCLPASLEPEARVWNRGR